MDREDKWQCILIFGMVLIIAIGSCLWKGMIVFESRAAMESGYEQVLEKGFVLWKKKEMPK